MIRIAITQAAFEAIAATQPLGGVGFEAERTNVGNVFIRVETRWARKFSACAGWVQAAIVYGQHRWPIEGLKFVCGVGRFVWRLEGLNHKIDLGGLEARRIDLEIEGYVR